MLGAGLGVALLGLLAGTAVADDALKLRELSPNGADACFGRVYDAAHLKAHPKQKVARIFFYYGHDPVSRPNEEPTANPDTSYNGFVTTTVRGAKAPQWASGWCNHEIRGRHIGPIRCGMDCDRTLASLKVDDKGRVLLSDLSPDIYLDPARKKNSARRNMTGRRSAPRTTISASTRCRPRPARPNSRASIRSIRRSATPLRVRLKPDQAFCYGRDYDAAHMSSHPNQLTQSIRVFRGPVELASFASGGDAANWPDGADIAVSVTTRQKSGKVTQTYSCQGEADQWRCAASAKMSDFSCDIAQKEIFLKRGANGTMMLANPNSSVAIVDLCSKAADGKTKSDDKVYRLEPMPQSACAP